ncbi:hypothetical protein RYX36_011488 [Vicia faba]
MDPLPPWRNINMNNTDWWRSLDIDNKLEAENYLNQLSEGVLIDVLTKVETKQAMYVCSHVLHQRHVNTWKQVNTLCFNSNSHQNLNDFDEYVNRVLTQRGNFKVNTLVYHCCGEENKTNEILLTRMLQYSFDHDVESIWINFKTFHGRSTKVTFPTFILESSTLKVLHLDFCALNNLNLSKEGKSSSIEELHLLNLATRFIVPLSHRRIRLPSSIMSHPFGFTWNSLTSLNIQKVRIRCGENKIVSPFEEMVNLTHLCISQTFFRPFTPAEFVISAPKLSNIRLTLNKFGCKVTVMGKKLKKMAVLVRVVWLQVHLYYISIEGGLLITTEESEIAASEHGLFKINWSQEKGNVVDMSYDKFDQVRKIT